MRFWVHEEASCPRIQPRSMPALSSWMPSENRISRYPRHHSTRRWGPCCESTHHSDPNCLAIPLSAPVAGNPNVAPRRRGLPSTMPPHSRGRLLKRARQETGEENGRRIWTWLVVPFWVCLLCNCLQGEGGEWVLFKGGVCVCVTGRDLKWKRGLRDKTSTVKKWIRFGGKRMYRVSCRDAPTVKLGGVTSESVRSHANTTVTAQCLTWAWRKVRSGHVWLTHCGGFYFTKKKKLFRYHLTSYWHLNG